MGGDLRQLRRHREVDRAVLQPERVLALVQAQRVAAVLERRLIKLHKVEKRESHQFLLILLFGWKIIIKSMRTRFHEFFYLNNAGIRFERERSKIFRLELGV